MIEQLPGWIGVAGELAKLAKGRGQDWLAVALPPNAVLLLERFRAAYQAKDVAQVKEQLSAAYHGSLYSARTRDQFVRLI